MDPAPLLRGLALGVAIAAPVGPMSLLCMRRTLTAGFTAGLLSGLGVATADAVYGAVAAFGLVAITDFLLGHQPWLRLIGGGALVYLGVRMLRTRRVSGDNTIRGDNTAERPATTGAAGLAGMYASMLTLTLTNPTTILSFGALFVGLGVGADERDSAAAPAIVLGVFLGSALWWLVLSGAIALVRRRLPGRLLRVVNTVSGLAIVCFGVVTLASVLTGS